MGVDAEDQLDIALELVKSENAVVLFLCTHNLMPLLYQKLSLQQGSYNVQGKVYTSETGSRIFFRNTKTREEIVSNLFGYQWTHIIINSSLNLDFNAVNCLKIRIRSSSYIGDMGIYHENGDFESV
jgi:hypothetical protein